MTPSKHQHDFFDVPGRPKGYLKDLVQEKTGFPRYRLTLLLADGSDGKSWEELGRPQEVQAVFNQVTTDMADELMHLGAVRMVMVTSGTKSHEDAMVI